MEIMSRWLSASHTLGVQTAVLRGLFAAQAAESLISHDDPFSAEEKAQSRDIKKSINLNLAAAHLKLNEHSDAIAAASKVCGGRDGKCSV